MIKVIVSGVVLVVLLALAAVTASFVPATLAPPANRALTASDVPEQQAVEVLKKLSPQELQDLTRRETEALKADPLDKIALQNLSILAGLQGDTAKSEKLALILSDYGRRSVGAQLAAVQINLAAKDFKAAFGRLDGALRARPEMNDKLFPLLTSPLGDKEAQIALGEILARDPPWREALLKYAIAQDSRASMAYALLSAVRTAKADVKDSEKRLVIEKLIKSGQVDAAYFVWLDLLPSSDLALVRDVFDGGFEAIQRQLYFDWHVPARKNARIEIAVRPGSGQDRALSLDFFSDTQGKEYVFQFLRLSPGEFNVDFEFLAEGLKTDSGLVWRVSCLANPEILGESQVIDANGPWSKSQFAFTVPETGCATQLLRLESRGKAKLDKEISGRLMFDNVVIRKAGENAADVETQQP